MKKVTLTKPLARSMMKGVDIDEYVFDVIKVGKMKSEMNNGKWTAEDHKREPIGIHHDSKLPISGHEIILAFLSSALERIDVYIIDNV